jgi:ankyrin repeat protein
VRVLAREGKPKNETTNHLGMTPLHFAAREGHILIVNFLLNEGVVPDTRNRAGHTPYDLVKPIIDKIRHDKKQWDTTNKTKLEL